MARSSGACCGTWAIVVVAAEQGVLDEWQEVHVAGVGCGIFVLMALYCSFVIFLNTVILQVTTACSAFVVLVWYSKVVQVPLELCFYKCGQVSYSEGLEGLGCSGEGPPTACHY